MLHLSSLRSDNMLKLEEKIWFLEYEGLRIEMCVWQERREVNIYR